MIDILVCETNRNRVFSQPLRFLLPKDSHNLYKLLFINVTNNADVNQLTLFLQVHRLYGVERQHDSDWEWWMAEDVEGNCPLWPTRRSISCQYRQKGWGMEREGKEVVLPTPSCLQALNPNYQSVCPTASRSSERRYTGCYDNIGREYRQTSGRTFWAEKMFPTRLIKKLPFCPTLFLAYLPFSTQITYDNISFSRCGSNLFWKM
jgi:hypothetical protein